MKLLPVAAAAAAALTLASCKHTPPANVAAEVNSHAITYNELDKTYQSQYAQQAEGATEDQIMAQKLDVLSNLITNEIMLQRAERMGLTAVDADVDAEISKMRAPYTKEEFEKTLADRHMTLDDLKAQIRAKLTVDKLVNKEITSKITITDADVKNFYEANKPSFNLAEPAVHMAQILVTQFPDPNVHNLKNSKAQNDKEAQTKIQDIAARLKRGEDFAMLAQNYSEDPNSAPNGGDMGFVKESDLDKANPDLRKMVFSLPNNGISPIIHTGEGYRILKVITHEPAGQRELNDPRVQQNIRETLINSKDQLLRAAYYETARNSAKIENYLARGVVENAGKGK
ncbi:MAG TPA: peptidylprolyl isomerase [Candidatus Acidoferrales bacterium]|nr:peptidylprolyl isomerase [Candidatus Acidoferrales bacterium]